MKIAHIVSPYATIIHASKTFMLIKKQKCNKKKNKNNPNLFYNLKQINQGAHLYIMNIRKP